MSAASTSLLPSHEDIASARDIVRTQVPPTPTYRWPLLEQRLGATVHVKHENHTALGAFKLRGGAVYVHELRQRTGLRAQDVADGAVATGLQEAVVGHPLVAEHLGQVAAPAVRQQHDDDRLRPGRPRR